MKKGWCPGAHRPMASGDGLILRVRPQCARLTAAQALGLCAAAERHGSGILELTSRANLQIRGVTQAAFPPLLAALDMLAPRAEAAARVELAEINRRKTTAFQERDRERVAQSGLHQRRGRLRGWFGAAAAHGHAATCLRRPR